MSLLPTSHTSLPTAHPPPTMCPRSFANVAQAAAAQCFRELNQTVLELEEGFERDLSPMAAPPNGLLFTEARAQGD